MNCVYLLLSLSSSRTTSSLPPAADSAETTLNRPNSRPTNGNRMVKRCLRGAIRALALSLNVSNATSPTALPRSEAQVELVAQAVVARRAEFRRRWSFQPHVRSHTPSTSSRTPSISVRGDNYDPKVVASPPAAPRSPLTPQWHPSASGARHCNTRDGPLERSLPSSGVLLLVVWDPSWR